MAESKTKTFLTLKQSADQSGISLHWWRQAAKDGKVPGFKSGVKFYVDYPAAIEKIRSGDLNA